MEIVYCVDENAVEQMEMSAATVMKFNPKAHITVISQTPVNTRYDNLIRELPKIKFRHTENDRLSDAAYMRIFLPEWMKNDKVLYLDADTLCTGSLDELFNRKIEFIGAVHSHNYGIRQAEQIGIEQYALDAVMLLNLKNLRKIGYVMNSIAAMQYAQFPKTNWYCDETLLNCCFSGLITFIELKWDFCVNRKYDQYPDAIQEKDAVILHFIGGQKEKQKEYFNLLQ